MQHRKMVLLVFIIIIIYL